VLEQGRFERQGSSSALQVDVRIIAATNRNLFRDVQEGKFRKDFYYRLNVFPVAVPPLREHPEDTPLLGWAFVRQYEQSMGKRIEKIPRKCMGRLRHYPWPGDARELRTHSKITSHFIRRCISFGCVAKARNIQIFLRFRALPNERLNA
jgi:transcriptional regulator with GAF, ATPase, and Fis domain